MAERTRRTRANGDASRARILDAATEIAGERGYEGTSIKLVSARCGLPASSIYWHFTNKDMLIAAVIERSYSQWADAWHLPEGGDIETRVAEMISRVGKALSDSPDFLRLGLMLALERRPVEPDARAMFLRVRSEARRRIRDTALELLPELGGASAEQLATYAMAGADGVFIAREIDGDAVDVGALFRLHAQMIVDAAARLVAEEQDTNEGDRS